METHVFGKAPVVFTLSGARPAFPGHVVKVTQKAFEIFGNVARTSDDFLKVMAHLRKFRDQNNLVGEQAGNHQNARDAIQEGYDMASKLDGARTYVTRLTSFADEFRSLVVCHPAHLSIK